MTELEADLQKAAARQLPPLIRAAHQRWVTVRRFSCVPTTSKHAARIRGLFSCVCVCRCLCAWFGVGSHFVHGDLRRANIMAKLDAGGAVSKLLLIDMDWSGRAGVDR